MSFNECKKNKEQFYKMILTHLETAPDTTLHILVVTWDIHYCGLESHQSIVAQAGGTEVQITVLKAQ